MTRANAHFIIGDAGTVLSNFPLRVDAIVTDPPYRIITKGCGFAKLRQPHFSGLAGIGASPGFDIMQYMPMFERICDPLVLLMFCSKNELPKLLEFSEKERDYAWEIMTWHKKNPMPLTNGHILRDTEFIVYIRKRGSYFPHGADFDIYRSFYISDSPLRKVGRGQISQENAIHPCTKPLKLMERLVRLASPPGGLVLDPFAGSGTTLDACLKHGINSIGIEMDSQWRPLLERSCRSRKRNVGKLEVEYESCPVRSSVPSG